MGVTNEELANLKAAFGIETKRKLNLREMRENIEKANAAMARGLVLGGDAQKAAEKLLKEAKAELELYNDKVKTTNKIIKQQQKIIEFERQRSHSLEAQRQLHVTATMLKMWIPRKHPAIECRPN